VLSGPSTPVNSQPPPGFFESRTNPQTGLPWPLAIFTNRIGSAQESLRPLEPLIELRKLLPLSIEVLFVHEQFMIVFVDAFAFIHPGKELLYVVL
jgi:hypothetical protein